MAFRMSLMV
jgi:hypothetical protein